MVYHLGDIVEIVGTGRRAKLANLYSSTEQGPERYDAFFLDGKNPILQSFNRDELCRLRLVSCPHVDDGPRTIPAEWPV